MPFMHLPRFEQRNAIPTTWLIPRRGGQVNREAIQGCFVFGVRRFSAAFFCFFAARPCRQQKGKKESKAAEKRRTPKRKQPSEAISRSFGFAAVLATLFYPCLVFRSQVGH